MHIERLLQKSRGQHQRALSVLRSFALRATQPGGGQECAAASAECLTTTIAPALRRCLPAQKEVADKEYIYKSSSTSSVQPAATKTGRTKADLSMVLNPRIWPRRARDMGDDY
jgi:hypothetical protein